MVKVKGIRANRPMKIVTDANGKTKVVVDHKSVLKSLPVNARIARRKSCKVTVSKAPRLKGG